MAKRVATETAIQQKRVSIPSVAVAEFAKSVFERFDDKHVLVIGAGEMGEETLRYLIDEGAQHISLVNRSRARAEDLATRLAGQPRPWRRSARAAGRGRSGRQRHRRDRSRSLTAADFRSIVAERYQRPLLDSRPGDSRAISIRRSAS